MSRRNIAKKRFPGADPIYNSNLVNLLIKRILKCGKKYKAYKIVYTTLIIINEKTNEDPLIIFEKAIQNVSPIVEIKSRRIGGSTYQVPIEVSSFRATNLALSWLILYSKRRVGRSMAKKLASEIIDSSNDTGSTIKKKEEIHKIAAANKTFAHLRY